MCNKFIIASLLLGLSLGVFAQTGSDNTAVGSVEVSQFDVANKIELYPNPATDFLVVRITNSTLASAEFELHSIIGNEITIRPEDLGNGRYRIPIKEFASGYYFVVVKDDNARFKEAFKFLKK